MFRSSRFQKYKGQFSTAPWLGKMAPFKIFGDTYFVGTFQSSSHLIDTGDGLILIDTGYMNSAYLLVDSIHKLGFELEDIRYIINSHWHADHVEATAAIAAVSGAKTLIGAPDGEKALQYFTPDILINDGDTLTLGNKTISFMLTPGHTAGTISIFYLDSDGEKECRVGMFGGAGLNTLHKGKFDFEGAREAYYSSIERLKKERVDVFIGNHTWNNDTAGKYEKMLDTDENEFIDGDLWAKFLDNKKSALDALIESEQA